MSDRPRPATTIYIFPGDRELDDDTDVPSSDDELELDELELEDLELEELELDDGEPTSPAGPTAILPDDRALDDDTDVPSSDDELEPEELDLDELELDASELEERELDELEELGLSDELDGTAELDVELEPNEDGSGITLRSPVGVRGDEVRSHARPGRRPTGRG